MCDDLHGTGSDSRTDVYTWGVLKVFVDKTLGDTR